MEGKEYLPACPGSRKSISKRFWRPSTLSVRSADTRSRRRRFDGSTLSGCSVRSAASVFVPEKRKAAEMWEDRRLRDLTEVDIRALVAAGQQEHLQLEYKSALYGNSDAEVREFLQDICMFANSGGGILLIGVTELRDVQNHATGFPDPAAQLGIEHPNPEQVLLALDARVVACIGERLPLESASIPVGNSRQVLAIRVPN